MNSRERLINFLQKKEYDRLPYLEWATWWNLTRERWLNESGYGKDLTPKEYKNNLGLDYDLHIWFQNMLSDCPRFKEQGYISNEKEYEEILPYLYRKEIVYDMRDRLISVHEDAEESGDITWITLSGFFWFPRVLLGIEDHLYSFYDQSELYHRICRDMVTYYEFLLDEVTKYISPVFMTFAEDMSYNLGPMLSEDMFDEFILPYYRKLIPVLKGKGISVFVDSDGDISRMIPWLIRAGVDGILPLERQAGVDINQLSVEYPDFFFIGGFDKMVMKFGKEAMQEEFERIKPAILNKNYLPSVDHQTPPDVSLDNYRAYIELLHQYCSTGNDCADK